MKAVSRIEGNNRLPKPIEFPCLMQSEATGIVVLFISQTEGTVLVGNEDYGLGYCCNDRGEASIYPWKHFDGKLAISNE
jgi:hypothetical protein